MFIHSSVNGHLGYFHLLATVDAAAVNIRVLVSVQALALDSFGCILGNGLAGSYGDSVFSFLRRALKFLKS